MPRGAHSSPWLLAASVEGCLSLPLLFGKLGCGSGQGGGPKNPQIRKLFHFTSLPFFSLTTPQPQPGAFPPSLRPALSLTPPHVREFSRCDRFSPAARGELDVRGGHAQQRALYYPLDRGKGVFDQSSVGSSDGHY